MKLLDTRFNKERKPDVSEKEQWEKTQRLQVRLGPTVFTVRTVQDEQGEVWLEVFSDNTRLQVQPVTSNKVWVK